MHYYSRKMRQNKLRAFVGNLELSWEHLRGRKAGWGFESIAIRWCSILNSLPRWLETAMAVLHFQLMPQPTNTLQFCLREHLMALGGLLFSAAISVQTVESDMGDQNTCVNILRLLGNRGPRRQFRLVAPPTPGPSPFPVKMDDQRLQPQLPDPLRRS